MEEQAENRLSEGVRDMNFEEAKKLLAEYGQEHILEGYDTLTEEQQENLLAQISNCDFSVLHELEHRKEGEKRGVISPLPTMQLDEIEANKEKFRNTGVKTIQAGKVGAVLLAGGMGTRLGSDDPKGMYNIGITKDMYIFERIIRNLLDVVEETGTWIHLFVMTSDKNHAATTKFLKEKNYFGYKEAYVNFFMQEMAPATDYQGKVYMEAPGVVAMSPNGNGGWFSSMKRWGVLDKVKEAGIEYLNVFAVDNVLQRIADPVFVGAVVEKNAAVGSKVVKKVAPDEKVGVVCLEDGRPSIIEYYELTDELMNTLDEKGERVYNFGVILNYLFRVTDLYEIVDRKLPLHVVEKKIPYMDEQGNRIKPEEPNGYKFENLVLDMIHMEDSCLPFEVVRNYEFAPIKNKTGVDSVDSARKLLQQNGVEL